MASVKSFLDGELAKRLLKKLILVFTQILFLDVKVIRPTQNFLETSWPTMAFTRRFSIIILIPVHIHNFLVRNEENR